MGSGHGGWLSDSFCNGFYGGSMEVFTHLAALHFHHDCTDHLLGLITQRNSSTLKILDISFSQNVSDSSAKFIVNCQSLTELDIIGTSLSGQVRRFSFPFSAKQCSEGYLEFKMNSVNYESVKIQTANCKLQYRNLPHCIVLYSVHLHHGVEPFSDKVFLLSAHMISHSYETKIKEKSRKNPNTYHIKIKMILQN